MERKHFFTALTFVGGAILTSEIAKTAFHQQAKETMRERAYVRFGKVCSEISGRDDQSLHAAHINHKRNTGYYNSPNNGFYCTITEHLIDHILREGENGLNKSGNYEAINSLSRLIMKEVGEEGLSEVYTFVSQDGARQLWQEKIDIIIPPKREVKRLDTFYRKSGSVRIR